MYGFLGFSGNFYLTLLPTYLKHHRHLDSGTAAWLTSLPFAFGVVACLVGGSLSDAIIRRWGKAWSRRISWRGGPYPGRDWRSSLYRGPRARSTLGFLLTLAFFGNDLAMAPAWAAAADIGGRYTGVLSGTMNMMASFMAALEARLAGRLAGTTQPRSSVRASRLELRPGSARMDRGGYPKTTGRSREASA